jgi:hypothetical protein
MVPYAKFQGKRIQAIITQEVPSANPNIKTNDTYQGLKMPD